MYFIGIDIGTTNTKLCLFRTPDFKCIYKYTFLTPKESFNNESNFQINDIYSGIKKGLKIISSKVKYIEEIKNISVASVGEAGVIIDANGETIGPCITWYDTRTSDQLQEIKTNISSEEIYDITGVPPHTNYSLSKILWLRENYSNKFNKFHKWLCIAEYIVFKLTGCIYSEYSLASRTMVFDLKNKKWSDRIISATGLNRNIFPQIIGAGQQVGTILKSISEETGLSDKTTVSIGGHDHMCGAIAAGLDSDNGLLNSTGTTEGILALTNEPKINNDFFRYNLSNGIYVLDQYYTIFASLPAAGLTIEWYAKNILNEPSIDKSICMLESIAEYKHDIIFIPHLRGSGPPYRSINSKCLLYGIRENSKSLDILYAIFEGLCFELKNLIDSMEELLLKKYSSVKVIGSACKNPFWLQLKADILNKEIISYKADEAVAKGAAILAAYKNEYVSSLDVHRDYNIYTPNPQKAEMYAEIFMNSYMPLYNFKKIFEKNREGD